MTAAADRLRGAIVLIVEDDAKSAKLASVVLKQAGCEVHVARDATVAASLVFGGLRPAVVLMDLDLPGVTGIELARVLKTLDTTKDIPIIAITASGGDFTEANARAAGCMGYIRKPIEPDLFPEQIAKYLDER
jgi:CheY-like chemotaxis protein